jgi:hypothetical protein
MVLFLPIGFKAVIPGHRNSPPRYGRVFYLVRDGRDVLVSSYCRILQEIRHPRYGPQRPYHRKRQPGAGAVRC